MAALKFSLILLLFITSCASANNDKISFDNGLEKCINFSNITLVENTKIPLLLIDLEVVEPISGCGCKSALGEFTVTSLYDTYESYLITGKIPLLESGEKHIPISTDSTLIKNKQLNLKLNCSRPD